MCANAVRGMYLSVHRSRCLSEIVKSPRPLQRLVYAVQVDGVDGNRHTNDDAVDVGESKSRRAATAPAGAAASMAALCVDLFGPYPQRQRRLVNRLYGSHHDRPCFQLARSRGTTNNHKSDDQKRSTVKRGQSKKKPSISYRIKSID